MTEEKKKPGRPPKAKIEPKAEMKPDKVEEKQPKTLNNVSDETLKANVGDVQLFANADKWLCIGKCWSAKEKWMHSTKAMNIPGFGCVVQVSTQQGEQVTTSLTSIQGVGVYPSKYGGHRLVGHLQKDEPEV